jgi:hypothetical protein
VHAHYGHAKFQPVDDVQKDGWGIANTCESQSSMSAGLLPDMANRACGGTPPPVFSPVRPAHYAAAEIEREGLHHP